MTTVTPLRKGGRGIEGTYANANHHAQRVIPMIDALKPYGTDWAFAEWKQGHNVHEFVTSDGRRFTLRAYRVENEYHGLRLSIRLSRSVEVPLCEIKTLAEVPVLAQMMGKLARPIVGDVSGPAASQESAAA